jgi:hypothetical protein
MCLPFLNLFVWYDALFRGWCVAYVGDASAPVTLRGKASSKQCIDPTDQLSPTSLTHIRIILCVGWNCVIVL